MWTSIIQQIGLIKKGKETIEERESRLEKIRKKFHAQIFGGKQ
jgi:hypothetical protein